MGTSSSPESGRGQSPWVWNPKADSEKTGCWWDCAVRCELQRKRSARLSLMDKPAQSSFSDNKINGFYWWGSLPLWKLLHPMHLSLCCTGVSLDKIYQLQPPGKINLASLSETRPQVQNCLRQPFSDISGLLSTGEFRCLSSEQIIMYSWELEIDQEGEKCSELCLHSLTAL